MVKNYYERQDLSLQKIILPPGSRIFLNPGKAATTRRSYDWYR